MERAPRTAWGGGAVVVLTLLVALVEAVEASRLWHEAQTHRAQAKAASKTARLLREAAAVVGAPPSRSSAARTARDVTGRGPWPDHAWWRYRCAAPCAGPAQGRSGEVPLTRREERSVSTPEPAAVPAIDPFAESMAEAAQSAAAAFPLMLTISDAVRRAAQKLHQGEEELAEGEEKLAPGWAADALRPLLDRGVLAGLMAGEDWPRMAGQMVLLQRAGVDLTTFLPQLGQVAMTVFQAVEANRARIQVAGTDRWADLLKATMPGGLVRDAILASPAWPDVAAKTALLDQQGVDVAGFLAAAHGRTQRLTRPRRRG
ncbi:hypothetical protein [Streptomyces sp. NBC_01006]|uniref:hypothetical protein n=1 Tax=Streptomyces sp. NBC_01006 TaxID=2903716 RepID=UPI00386F9F32|nr:hypothetical protein OG509_39165 [Streptomyces sp. NBC_01006]